jgi:hypothetical protein
LGIAYLDDERVPDPLHAALARSAELAGVIKVAWDSAPAFENLRARAALGLCALSIEHGCAVQALLSASPASAITLVRPQYESLIRAVWAAHAADGAELNLLLAPLTAESQHAAKKLPGVVGMLAALEKSGPPGAAALLGRAKARLGDGLNSFVHGGIHPFARQREGYPIVLLLDVLKNSNALAILTLLVLLVLTEDGELPAVISTLHGSFQDVLPAIEPLDS